MTNANTNTTYVTANNATQNTTTNVGPILSNVSITHEGSKKTLKTEQLNLYVNNKAVNNLAEFSSNMSAIENDQKSENTKRAKLSSQASAAVM